MIFGIGCDLARTARIEKSLCGAHGARFAREVYGEKEQAALGLIGKTPDGADAAATADITRHAAESAAADFAAKEAFLKAAGTGLSGFALCEIEALRRENGAPYYAFSGKAAAWLAANGLTAQLSLSHEGEYALAFCTLEKTGE